MKKSYKKRGPKPKPEGEAITKHFTVSCSGHDLMILNAIAQAHGVSRSAIAMRAVRARYCATFASSRDNGDK